MEQRRVVITGIGTINPIGNNIEEYFRNLEQGVSGADTITAFDATKFSTRIACEVKNFDPSLFFDRKELRKYDRYSQFAMVAATEAVEDAAIDFEKINLERAGVVWASGVGGMQTFYDEVMGWAGGNGTPRFSPFFVPKMISDLAAGHISLKYGFMGPNYSVVSACASSNHAMIDAFNLIRLGKANVMVTGGAEAAVYPAGVGGFNSMHALSTRNDSPETASRPFSASRDGFVIGEGSAVLILEELEHAKARGAKIYAEVAGGGLSADAYHLTATHPEGLGAILAMNNALEDAEMKPEDIDYINVHGTSTHVGDISEAKAIKEVFGENAYKLNISSTKSMTGHLLGAAGALEAVLTVLALKNGIVPPTANLDEIEPECDLDYTPNNPVTADLTIALSDSLGFGGHNGCVAFRKYVQ